MRKCNIIVFVLAVLIVTGCQKKEMTDNKDAPVSQVTPVVTENSQPEESVQLDKQQEKETVEKTEGKKEIPSDGPGEPVVVDGSTIYPDTWLNCTPYTRYTVEEANKTQTSCGYKLFVKKYKNSNIQGRTEHIPYVQIKGMENKKLQKKINACLKARQTEWITKDVWWIYDNMDIKIMLMTKEYLSIKCFTKDTMNYAHPECGESAYCIVVDLRKGRDLKLEDLFDLKDIFKKIEIINTYGRNDVWDNKQREYREKQVNSMNMTILELYKQTNSKLSDSYQFEDKASFAFVKEGLYMYRSNLRDGGNEVLDFHDIQDILKIEKW